VGFGVWKKEMGRGREVWREKRGGEIALFGRAP